MIQHLLNRVLTVKGWTETSDGMGGTIRTEVVRGTFAAKVDEPTAEEQVVAAQAESRHTHSIYFAPDADVRRGDELSGDGQTFRVVSVMQPSRPVYLKARCELIQTEG